MPKPDQIIWFRIAQTWQNGWGPYLQVALQSFGSRPSIMILTHKWRNLKRFTPVRFYMARRSRPKNRNDLVLFFTGQLGHFPHPHTGNLVANSTQNFELEPVEAELLTNIGNTAGLVK